MQWQEMARELMTRAFRRTVASPALRRKSSQKLQLQQLEDRVTPDVKVFTDGTLTTQVGSTYTGASAILDAANNILTLDGHVLTVDTANAPVGGYTAGNIPKSLSIWGTNKGIDPNTGVRVPEVFVNTSAGAMSPTSGKSVEIDGLSFTTVGGQGAIFTTSTPNYSVVFKNNIVKDQNAPATNGMQLGVGSAVPAGITSANISHNLFDGMTTGSAIRVSTSANVVISDNVILNSRSGMQIQASINGVNSIVINNNYIDTTVLSGIRLEGNVNSPTVTNNTILNANTSNNPNHAGIRVATNFAGSPGVTGLLTIRNNLISGSNNGIRFTDGTFADITGTDIALNSIDVNPLMKAFLTGDTNDSTIDFSGNWTGTAASAAAVETTATGTRDFVIQSYLSGNSNTRLGATSKATGVWGFDPNLAIVDMIVPQTKVTSGLTFIDGSIQSGINRAKSGMTIRIAADTFTGNVSALGNAVTLYPLGQVTINGNLTLNSDDTIRAELGGPSSLTDYNNFVVNGTVTLGNANLTLAIVNGYVIAPGTFPSFTIIANDSTDAIANTFFGLAEGGTISAGGYGFTATYVGAPGGNDFILTRNLAPTDISISNSSINENSGVNAPIGNFSTTDPDVGGSYTYTLVSGTGSTGNGSFNISGNTLQENASFDFETQSTYSIRVRTTDQSGLWFEKVFVITILDVNEAPTNILLSNSSILENAGFNAVIGTLSSVDPDIYAPPQTFTYTLVAGAGATGNASFNILGNTLRENASFNYEVQNSYSIRIRTTDQGGLWFEKVFTITILNAEEGPGYILMTRYNNTAEWLDSTGAVVQTVNLPPLALYGQGLVAAVGDRTNDVTPFPDFFYASGSGVNSLVSLVNGQTGVVIWSLSPFGTFKGGVNVAAADINGDGVMDLIVGSGPNGGPNVKVYDGSTKALLRDFNAFVPSFKGGVTVAGGDVNGDGKADIVVGVGGTGQPNVRVFSGASTPPLLTAPTMLYDFYAFSQYTQRGVSVSVGDVNSDGYGDIMTSTLTGGSNVRIYSGGTGLPQNVTPPLLLDFLTSGQFSGVQIKAIDFTGDGKFEFATLTTTDANMNLNYYGYTGSPTTPNTMLTKAYPRPVAQNPPLRIG